MDVNNATFDAPDGPHLALYHGPHGSRHDVPAGRGSLTRRSRGDDASAAGSAS